MHAAAGALLLALPSSTVALAATAATAAPAASAASIESVDLGAAHVAYGQRLAVTGTAGPNAAGEPVELQIDTADTGGWSDAARGTVSPDGGFHLTAPVHRSGSVRVIGVPASTLTSTAGAVSAAPSATGNIDHTVIQPSLARRITVGADLSVANQELGVLGGQSAEVTGRLRPGVRGRRVVLQERSGRRWSAIATARTRARGRFHLRFIPQTGALHALRVSFAGDSVNAAASANAGNVTVYSPTVASWYDDAGDTACGFHAYYGVANLSLPCGTKVTFRSGGRTVTATVDDRGPYVGGRSYDLNQNTAAALGFGGVGTVWASVS